MGKTRFQSNPYPDLALSEEDQALLLDLTNTLVQQNLVQYQRFVVHDKRQVDPEQWKHVKSRDDIHVHVRREDPQELHSTPDDKTRATPVMLSVGTFPGQLDDLMLGVMNPTLDSMRVKASYVHDVSDAAILAPILEPTEEDPFLSVAVKWMQRDLPLEATSLVKNRDFVYVEATGVLHFATGQRIGYHLMHSIDFPQTRALPNVVRGNLSICCMFRQLSDNVIDNHSFSTLEPGGELPRFLMLPIAAEALLSTINYVPCGQMTKLAWLIQQKERSLPVASRTEVNACSACSKRVTRGRLGSIGSGTCRICSNAVCLTCKVRKRVARIAPDGKLRQSKLTFCVFCAHEASTLDALEVSREMTRGYGSNKMSSLATSSSLSLADSDQS